MLSSSSGEKVFVGTTAAISFLQFLQKTLKHFAGPSGFTDEQHSRKLFEAAAYNDDVDSLDGDLGATDIPALIQCFLEVSSGLLDLFTSDEIARLLELARSDAANEPGSSSQMSKAETASLHLMIAIGAQCRGRVEVDLSRAVKHFCIARKTALAGMLEDPTVSVVRIFLLMAFYMLGACRRNSAFMYIGIASKAADIIGLHLSAHIKHLSVTERGIRMRTAHSLRAFDIICSSILGRQSSATPLRSFDVQSRELTELAPEQRNNRAMALLATRGVTVILDESIRKSTEEGKLDTNAVEDLLQRLRDWSHALPSQLRQRVRKDDDPNLDSRELTIGSIHVAGVYYFGVILLTRPFLVQRITPQLRGRSTPLVVATDEDHAACSGKEDEFAQVCVEAATYMVHMCSEAMDAGLIWGNMCILKAWVFAAGLVLGFSLLVDSAKKPDSDGAFLSSQRILQHLGRFSPLAAQYHHILTTFSDAIYAYREQLNHERRISKPRLVECILSLDQTSNGVGVSGPSELSSLDYPLGVEPAALEEGVTTYLTDPLTPRSVPVDWPQEVDEDLMLRLLWDGCTMNFINQGLQGYPNDCL